MVTKYEGKQNKMIQVEARVSICRHVSFDEGLTYQRVAIIPARKLEVYASEREAGLELNCMV